MWPKIDDDSIERVVDILKSGKLNQWNNNVVKEFEEKFSNKMDCKYGVAVFNGTVALELCIKALSLKKGDEVIVTPRTFIASASCCVINKLKPVFVDVDLESQNITLENIKEKVNSKTKAIILVHLAGWPCDVEEICEFAKKNNIYIIEDCAQAHGAKYKGKSVGSFGDIAAWSFCQDKIISTGGEGGMITTNCEKLFKRAWSLKDHGKDYDLVFNTEHEFGYKWLHTNIGSNYRMMPIQAAIGIEQLKMLRLYSSIRNTCAKIYNKILSKCKAIIINTPSDDYYHAYYKYYFFIKPEMFKVSRNTILKEIIDKNIEASIGSCGEIYNERALIKYKPDDICINAKQLFDTGIMVNCYICQVDKIKYNAEEILKILLKNMIN